MCFLRTQLWLIRIKLFRFFEIIILSCLIFIIFRLDSLKEVHRARQAELRRMAGDVENATASMELLEDVSSESQLKFYRNMTLYIHNLVECLQEKVRI